MAKQEWIEFDFLRVEQPLGIYYIAAMECQDVIEIAYADIRRIEQRDIEKIVGIQRDLSPPRVKELKKYVRNIDAGFPTSVILAVNSDDTKINERSGKMQMRRSEGVAKIIDGQHRLAGLEGFEGNFELSVTIFIDMDVQDQAMTFATINLSQTKVNKSLVYDLYELQMSRSPQKTCHQIARLLNAEDDSPLQGRIKLLGRATGEPFQFITQATFVEKLDDYITTDAMRDRDLLKRGKQIPDATGSERERLIFRDLFKNGKDAEIAKVVWNYFEAVAQRWPTAWNSDEQGDMLNRTNGFSGLMRFLGPVYRAEADLKGRLPVKSVLQILKQIKLRDTDFNRERFPPGTTGESALFRELRELSGLE